MAAMAPDKPMTKAQVISAIAETTGLPKKDVASVFEALNAHVAVSLSNRGPKVFTIPGLVKLRIRRKPATKARKGINPFTGEETVFKAKPARNVVKATPLKALKDMA